MTKGALATHGRSLCGGVTVLRLLTIAAFSAAALVSSPAGATVFIFDKWDASGSALGGARFTWPSNGKVMKAKIEYKDLSIKADTSLGFTGHGQLRWTYWDHDMDQVWGNEGELWYECSTWNASTCVTQIEPGLATATLKTPAGFDRHCNRLSEGYCSWRYVMYENQGFAFADNMQIDGPSPYMKITLTAVPEPQTWAMMIVGFGLTGAALRRRSASRFPRVTDAFA